MGTRPRVHRSEVAHAIHRIAARRTKVDDPHRDRLPDSPDSDPREVLDYLQKYSGPDIPRWVLQADVSDALILNNWLWWEQGRRELHILRVGRDRGLYLSQMGAQLGIGKQGVRDRIDRLDALFRYDRPDEKLARAYRAAAARRPEAEVWIADHHLELRSVINEIVTEADRYNLAEDDREFIDELDRDARQDDFSPATMALLGLASSELRTAAPVVKLFGDHPSHDQHRRPHRVHTVLERADSLRSQFAALGQ
ncbi:hypothetical protein AN480_27235 (plasmid) [Mycobacterium intracellulare subsp. chimaera]|uniref:Uncharacterized protein n=1 Tax=Mycobacterium intracellulare subsp. chimaera TaxID=222805 RepID=A0ABT7P3D2_MYCIT|nr:hypothetical protein [Mycobacterium intracellulare]APD84557.1 hypothetical protein AN480_27235 [Mycobacterium intracellulare subsp. chimaera]MDM3927782.1 hypothetical protein [Mycobacterium intracellulare subsp. chimaera]